MSECDVWPLPATFRLVLLRQMQIPIPTPHANSIKNVQMVITTIHSDVMPKIFSSMGAARRKVCGAGIN